LRIAALALAVPIALAQSLVPVIAQNLVANPAFVRDLPPPGWLADRRADWIAQHPVYQSACQTTDVSKEIEFLNRVVGRDENLLALAANPPQDNSALAREAEWARQELDVLRDDRTAADELVAKLQGLPACPPAAESTNTATAPAATVPEPPAETAPPAAPAAAAMPAPDTAQTVTLRYDDKVLGLTPLSIRAFNKAVAAIRAGRDIRLAIDGCGRDADFSEDSPCAKRLDSLKRLLEEHDIRHRKRVLSGLP